MKVGKNAEEEMQHEQFWKTAARGGDAAGEGDSR